MQTRRVIGIIYLIGCTAISQNAVSQDLEKGEKALGIINRFANDICNKPDMRGKSTTIEVQGKAKVEVSKLVKQLADLKIEGASNFSKNEYEGLLQKDLLPALQDSTKCKEKVYNDLKDRFLPRPNIKAAALNVQVNPDTVGIRVGSHQAVSYFFREVNGVQVTVDGQDIRWLLDNGSEIGIVKNGRVLGGSFTVAPMGRHELLDN